MIVGWNDMDARSPSTSPAVLQRRHHGKVVSAEQVPRTIELASIVQVPALVSTLRGFPQVAGSCHAWLNACRPPAWDLGVHVAIHRVQGFLGASRCASLAATSRLWESELSAAGEAYQLPPLGFQKPQAAALEALAAPTFVFKSSLAEEDALYAALADRRRRYELPRMLGVQADICGHDEIYSMMEALRPHCRVPEEAVRVLFGPRVEREKTLLLHPRPIHYAVARRSTRLVRMLVGAASKAGNLDEMLQKLRNGGEPQAMSPLFFAVLFADKALVDTLKRAGSTINEVDISAAEKLYRAGLWGPLQERLQALELQDMVAGLEDGMQKARNKVALTRAAIRAALLG